MKHVLLGLLYWGYIELSAALPVEENPGFTPWTLEKRDYLPIDALKFSGLGGNQLGVFEASKFGVPDPYCRQNLPREGCWPMDEFTVDKMVAARKPDADNCEVSCLFYTSYLSGAAERTAEYILWDVLHAGAIEGQMKYQTIWSLHQRRYYPRHDKLDETPETKCAYLDVKDKDKDKDVNFIGCQRRYFMSMSKAMATKCSGEVFVMTMADLDDPKIDVPEDGIWWQVEFPTLIDEKNRAQDKKITKITYLQVPNKTPKEFEELQKIPYKDRKAPEIISQGEYWPNGPGKVHLDKFRARSGTQGGSQQKRGLNPSDNEEDSQQHQHSPYTGGFVKRADRAEGELCEFGDDCYPYPYPIEDMYESYKGVVW